MGLKIAVTGGTGFIGKEIVKSFLKNNLEVLSLQRQAKKNSDLEVIKFNLRELENFSYKKLINIDVLIHAAALVHESKVTEEEHVLLNFISTKLLFNICEKAEIKKFIFLSTAGVYGVNTASKKLDVESSILPRSFYAKAKLMSENYLLNKDSKVKVSILRLPLVYGDNAPGNYGLLEKLALLKIPLPFLNVKNKRSMVSVKNVALVVLKTAINNNLYLGLNLLAEKKSFSTKEIITKIRLKNNISPMLFPLPIKLIKLILVLVGQKKIYEQLFEDLEFISCIDIDKKLT